MNRTEHLTWAKERAIKELEFTPGEQGISNAFASITSDIRKHPETDNHPAIDLGFSLLMAGHLATESKMREFIEGFN